MLIHVVVFSRYLPALSQMQSLSHFAFFSHKIWSNVVFVWEWVSVCISAYTIYVYYTQLRYIQKLSHSICHIILTKFTRCTGLRLPIKSKKKHNAHTHRRKLQSMIRTKQAHAHSLTHIHIHRQWTRDGQKNRRFAQARPTFPHYECWKIQC